MFIYTCFFNETQRWTNSFLGARFFRSAILFAWPIGHAKKIADQNQSADSIEDSKKHRFLFLFT